MLRAFAFIALVLALATPALAPDSSPFDRKPWLEDYAALKQLIEQNYANATWLASPQGEVDLSALDRATQARLASATDAKAATQALVDFMKGLKDGHASLTIPQPEKADGAAEAAADTPAIVSLADPNPDVCHLLVEPDLPKPDYSLPFDKAVPAEILADGGPGQAFRTALLTLPGGTKVGLIRIQIFLPLYYAGACQEAWAAKLTELRAQGATECGEHCLNQVEDIAGGQLAQAFAKRLEELRHRGAQALVVDVGNNGGGSEWVDEFVRVLLGREAPNLATGYVRHPHHEQMFQRMTASILADLRREDMPSAARAVTERQLHEAAGMLRQMGETCDMGWIWREKRPWRPLDPANCDNLAFVPGLDPRRPVPPARIPLGDPAWEREVYGRPVGLPGQPGWTGPLYVRINAGTASASESFLSSLRLETKARYFGTATAGIGCGFINGRISMTLPNSRIGVDLPNCVRLTADGRNEKGGFQPDLLLPTREGESLTDRARRLLEMVETDLKQAG